MEWCTISTAFLSINGPMTVLLLSGLPIAKDLYAAKSLCRTLDATDSCTITRRVEVQRWPAVPTAPKKTDCVAMSMSALGATINALLPPISMIVRPNRPWTVLATFKPMLTEPVAETNGIRASSANFWPTVLRSPISRVKIAGSAPVSRQTRSAIFVTAIAVSGVFSEGFQTVASPQTAASAAFHDQTATGKLNAVITATTPRGYNYYINR